jgi:hypothetical protein
MESLNYYLFYICYSFGPLNIASTYDALDSNFVYVV